MSAQLSTHLPPKISTNAWEGSVSSKFNGGKIHNNHPHDELDQLITNNVNLSLGGHGKKHFSTISGNKKEEDFRPHLKIFDQKYHHSTVFDV